MPPARGRPRKGDHRMDAAIDHFAVMGYNARDVRPVVRDLLKMYGGEWKFLEDDCYLVVQEKLFEIEEEKQKQDQQLLLEYHQQQDGQQVVDEPPQHQEQAADEEFVEDPMVIEPLEHPMFIEPTVEEVEDREAALPLNAARRTGPRRPCYGWLSESEDEEEEQQYSVSSRWVTDTNLVRSMMLSSKMQKSNAVSLVSLKPKTDFQKPFTQG